ncbi:MAG: VWA domain-containing protein [Desulfobacteraceae bacterium]
MTPKPVVFALILFLTLVTGCGEDPPTAQKQGTQPAAAPPDAESVQNQAADPSTVWPFVADDTSSPSLADSLTARNFLLIFDGSGSMQKNDCAGNSSKINIAKEAVVAWSKSVPADANLGLYAFHSNEVTALPLSSGNRVAFMDNVMHIAAGGRTPLSQAMLQSYKALTAQGRRQLGYGEYTIVVVTDGIADSPDQLRKVVSMILEQSPINIYSIGFCIGSQHSLNQPGRTLYKSANNPDELNKGLQEVLAESEIFDESAFSQ